MGGTNRAVPLTQLQPGQHAVVRCASLPAGDAALLGAMGLRCEARVRLCRAGEPCIVAVLTGGLASCRIGLSRAVAECIVVEVEGGEAQVGSDAERAGGAGRCGRREA